ncbi:MAG: glycosyltransferase family 4 protein [Deltaproteobacteria bacterium]|nr:glycosyltransferase family 4 protein [Deltaproteobacteria bacterium]
MAIHLLILNYEYPPIGGGGGMATQAIAQALMKKGGYHITVITGGVGQETVETVETVECGITVIRLPCAKSRKHRASSTFSYMLRYILGATFYVFKNRRRLSFDVIHTHFAIPTGPAGLVISRILKIPNILTLHGGEIFKQPLELSGPHFFIRRLVRFIVNRSHHVTCNSLDTLQGAQKWIGITRPMKVITLGFAPPLLPIPPKPAHEGEAVRLIMVSRLVPRKNLSALITALKTLDKSLWHLTLVGDGPEEEGLKGLAKRLGIGDRIAFRGYLSEEEKYRELSQSDLFVLPSLHEGLGLVYFEAMYCGLPIITTNNGGQTDFLEPETNALLVPPGDVQALAEAIQRALNDPAWRKRCGENNRQKIRSLFIDNIIDDYDRQLSLSSEGHPG